MVKKEGLGLFYAFGVVSCFCAGAAAFAGAATGVSAFLTTAAVLTVAAAGGAFGAFGAFFTGTWITVTVGVSACNAIFSKYSSHFFMQALYSDVVTL